MPHSLWCESEYGRSLEGSAVFWMFWQPFPFRCQVNTFSISFCELVLFYPAFHTYCKHAFRDNRALPTNVEVLQEEMALCFTYAYLRYSKILRAFSILRKLTLDVAYPIEMHLTSTVFIVRCASFWTVSQPFHSSVTSSSQARFRVPKPRAHCRQLFTPFSLTDAYCGRIYPAAEHSRV